MHETSRVKHTSFASRHLYSARRYSRHLIEVVFIFHKQYVPSNNFDSVDPPRPPPRLASSFVLSSILLLDASHIVDVPSLSSPPSSCDRPVHPNFHARCSLRILDVDPPPRSSSSASSSLIPLLADGRSWPQSSRGLLSSVRVLYQSLTDVGNSVVLSAPAFNRSGTNLLDAGPTELMIE